ncbi:MAG: glycosyltransferase, partial [Candidatus Binatia bacterium]
RYLADWAAPRARAVSVVPTTIDVTSTPIEDAAVPPEPIVGWIGTRVNLMYLRAVLPALSDVAIRRPQAKLKIVCDDFLDAEGVAVVRKPWSVADEPSDLASFAVGIMPLPDDAWTRGKCAVKILQCFAASRPVVCSPVGANLEVVEHGRNGFFAESRAEWVARLDELLADPEMRRRMGAEGRKTVAQRYSTAGHVDPLLAAIGVQGARA